MFTWLKELTSQERKTLTAAFAGWSVDALDVMVYSFVIDRKSTRLNSSHLRLSRMPSSA